MTDQNHKEFKLLRLYTILSIPLMGVLLFTALTKRPDTPYFEEITVERINVVEPDGTRKLVIASSARQTEGTIGGVEVPIERTRPAGMIFFNDYGDEIGGLIFGGDRTRGAHSFTFDQAGQDQVVQLINSEWTDKEGKRFRHTGMNFVDRRTDQTVLDLVSLWKEAEAIEDPEERKRALAELEKEGVFGVGRMFVGRTANGQAGIEIRDGQGDVRLRLHVEMDGSAVIQFLDSAGNVVRTIGPNQQ